MECPVTERVKPVAATLDQRPPVAALERFGCSLVVWRYRFVVGGRLIHGAWDPLLRRIELFGVVHRPDRPLVAALAHELGHALAPAGQTRLDPESFARRFSAAVLARLAADRTVALAAALREMAQTRPATSGRAAGSERDLLVSGR